MCFIGISLLREICFALQDIPLNSQMCVMNQAVGRQDVVASGANSATKQSPHMSGFSWQQEVASSGFRQLTPQPPRNDIRVWVTKR
jgi:hypothetical protein